MIMWSFKYGKKCRLICYYNHDMLTHRSKCKDIPLNIVVSSWIHLVLLLQTDVVVWYAVFLEQAFTKLHMQIRAGHSSLHRWLLLHVYYPGIQFWKFILWKNVNSTGQPLRHFKTFKPRPDEVIYHLWRFTFKHKN